MTEHRRVLLVHDDPVARASLSADLLAAGWMVRVAASARGVWTVLSGFEPDVVVVDLLLPDATGAELAPKLRARGLAASTPIVALGRPGRTESLTESQSLPFAALIRSPEEQAGLPARLDELIGLAPPEPVDWSADHASVSVDDAPVARIQAEPDLAAELRRACVFQGKQLALLAGIAGALEGNQDPDAVLHITLLRLVDAGLAGVGAAYRVDGNSLRVAALEGFSERTDGSPVELVGYDSALWWLAGRAEVTFVPPRSASTPAAVHALGESLAQRTCIAIPLRAHDEPLGLVLIGSQTSDLRRRGVALARALQGLLGEALVSRIRQAEATRLADALRAAEARDALTGLATRQQFLELLRGEAGAAAPSVVICAAYDGLHRVNHVHGYAVGDALLAATGAAIRDLLPRRAFAGRVSGDAFAVMLAAPTTDRAFAVAETLRRVLAQLGGVHAPELKLTASVGVGWTNTTGASGDDGFAAAERALRRAKERGGDRVWPENGGGR